VLRPQHAVQEAAQPRVVAPVERLERGQLVRADAGDQAAVLGVVVRPPAAAAGRWEGWGVGAVFMAGEGFVPRACRLASGWFNRRAGVARRRGPSVTCGTDRAPAAAKPDRRPAGAAGRRAPPPQFQRQV
jgi:hypothetical protein